ncbi:hypothetical protein [Thalassospira xiamenensis]|uniref:Uncharacterized protein n=1 Tax=Thalassospira xiamenensis TaxID=220697 RepID=A0A285TSM7_9PROT|nr:hypothetical protein SAMN05428964_105242 [Thalassospira xiamenensis]
MANSIRTQVEETIRKHPGDPSKAAIELCVMLDERFDLAGNGWFDDDVEVLEAISSS